MNVLVTGGCGYKGHVLIPKLLDRGFKVTSIDTCWFGNYHSPHDNLTLVEGDVCLFEFDTLGSFDAVIHLASVANDPCSDLDPKLTWEVSALGTMRLAEFAKRTGVGRFVYASSGSVYGIKTEPEVTEDLDLLPISEYNKTKMIAERVLRSYEDSFSLAIVRPATVCGLSARMRLDVAVNLLTVQALSKGEITVLGGDQVRPNIHIDDICDLYLELVENREIRGTFNAGFENLKISEIAAAIADKTGARVVVQPSNDPRSYRVSSKKLLAETTFRPKKTVEVAIAEITAAFNAGDLKDEDRWYNLRWMQRGRG